MVIPGGAVFLMSEAPLPPPLFSQTGHSLGYLEYRYSFGATQGG